MTARSVERGGFDVNRALDIETRSGKKDEDIETFITKVDAVNAAIQAMKARYRYRWARYDDIFYAVSRHRHFNPHKDKRVQTNEP